MKKFKSLLLGCLAALLAFAIPFAACDTTPDDGGNGGTPTPPGPPAAVTTSLISIELDTSRVRKDYFVGDNFSAANLVVTATTKRSDSDRTTTRDVTSSAVIDSSAFRRTRVGSYDINVSYTLGNVTKEESYPVTVSDIQLTLDTSNFTTVYLVGSEFDDLTDENKITATAKTLKPGVEDVEEDVTGKVVWDTTKVDKNNEGEYPITASYTTDSGISRTASFNISYVESREGLNVSLQEGVNDTVMLDTTNTTASIDVSNIEVRRVNEWGVLVEGTEGLVTDYTTKLYNGATEVPKPASGTVYSNLTSGTYQIWVEKPSSTNSGYTLTGFALIYVVEDVVSDSFQKTSGDTAFRLGVDTLSKDWTYEVELSSSGVKQLTSKDVTVSGINCLTETTGNTTRNATVTYVYYDAKGQAKTQRITVPYTVKKDGNQTVDTKTFGYSNLTLTNPGNRQPLTNDNFAGTFLTASPTAEALDARPATDGGIIEIKGDALQVTFLGVGTLTVSARSTGESAHSNLGLRDKNGNFVAGRIISNESNAFELDYGEKGFMYDVSGSRNNRPSIMFTIYEPGTYTICNYSLDPDGSAIYTGYTRIYEIAKTDVYDTTDTQTLSSVGRLSEINLYKEEA